MNQLPYMPLYWNDLLSDNKVRVQSNEELGAYMRLLGAAWHEDIPGTLPADDDVLARLAGAELSLWRKLSRRILPCFALNEQTGRYEQKRMMEEHAKCVAQIEMKHARASAGATKRWGEKPKQSPPDAKAMLKHGSSNASQNQSQNQTQTPDPLLPQPSAGEAGNAVGELGKEEIWRWVCQLTGHAGEHKNRLEYDALLGLRGATAEGFAQIERYHAIYRADPVKHAKPRTTPVSLMENYHAEVGKAKLALGLNGHAAAGGKRKVAIPADWPAFLAHLASIYPGHPPEIAQCATWEAADRVMSGARGEYAEWRKTQ